MVVTRRTPVVPPPPSVRNQPPQGAQHPPRASFSKNTATASKDAGPSATVTSPVGSSNGSKDQRSGLDNNPEKRSKKSRGRSKNKYRKSNFQAFLDFLTKLLCLVFIIYTFSVCPQDTHLQSPICRGLTEYKRVVLDPYIIPPIRAMLAHPSVAPHIERAKPYVHRAVEITTPVLLRTQQQWNFRVVPQWEKRIVPEWNKRVVPLWNKYVVPQWDKQVAPHVQRVHSALGPYLLYVTQNYEQRVVPRIQVAIYNLQRWQRQAEPYVLIAATKTKDAYHAAKPYAVPLAKRSGHLLQQFTLFLREQRQKLVDPHVAKMWEKVKELGRGRQVIHETAPEYESMSSDAAFTIMETLGHDAVFSPTHSPVSAYDAVPTPMETDIAHMALSLGANETTEGVPHPASTEPGFTPERGPVVPTQSAGTTTSGEFFSSAESSHASELPISDTPAFVGDTAAPSATDLTSATSSSSTPPAAEEPTKTLASVTPSKITVPAASATTPPMNSRTDDEIDFDAFYAELGLEEPLEHFGTSEQDHSGLSSPPAETEEERAERHRLKAEETTRKRADIEARQAKWEAELQAQMRRSTAQLQSRLGDLRTAAAAELTSSVEVRSSIEELFSEAEKYLKGAEIYLKNLKGENRKPDEKLALWDRVADRVNDKFSERLSATEGIINAWYRIVIDNELQEVAAVSAEVREVAEKGQLDLGLDYAWLEDVTFYDWQRYHALIGASEEYAHEVASIQNGTHPKIVVINPMTLIFEDLESEIQDVVIGFETRLRRIKRDGERAFNIYNNGHAQKEEEKGSIVEPEGETVPEVTILPVPPEDAEEEEQSFIPPVVIGRSQEEVLEALGKIEPVGEVSDRPVNAPEVDPEEAVSRLVQEVECSSESHHTKI